MYDMLHPEQGIANVCDMAFRRSSIFCFPLPQLNHVVEQCFLIGWMVHPTVNKIFAGVNQPKGVNKGEPCDAFAALYLWIREIVDLQW